MNDYENKIKLKFRLLAFWYDAFEMFISDKKSNPRRALAEKIPNTAVTILDVCAGTANSSIAVAEKNDKNRITGIDLSPDMISIANRKIKKLNLKNIDISRMNAINMEFKDNEFDIIMISFGLHEMNFIIMNNVLKEMHRVLKKNGLLYIVDFAKENKFMVKLLLWFYMKIFEPSHMKDFINYDWRSILRKIGLNATNVEKYRFSQLITAVK